MQVRITTAIVILAAAISLPSAATDLIHDAEQQILEEQYGEQWAAQNVEVQKVLDEMYAK